MQSHQIFYINSANRDSGTNSYFTFTLPVDSAAGYDRVCLLACSIPKSFYVIQAGFNTFTLRENGVDTTISITPGNYSYLSFMAVLPPLLNAASPNGWTYSMTYPSRLTQPDTGHFTFNVSGNSSQPSFITTTNVHEQLGFEENSTNTFVGNSLTSTTVINFAQEETLYIHSNCSDNGQDDILQDVYDANSPPMSYIVYQNTGNVEAYSKRFTNSLCRSFSFSVTNENHRLMELNGRNVLMTLLIYRKDNISEVIKEVIRTRIK